MENNNNALEIVEEAIEIVTGGAYIEFIDDACFVCNKCGASFLYSTIRPDFEEKARREYNKHMKTHE